MRRGDFLWRDAPDGKAAYIGTNKDRDLMAFGRIKLATDGTPGDIEILASRADGELDGVRLNQQGTMARCCGT